MRGRAVVVVALVLAAGCSAVSFGDRPEAPTDTVTPVPITETESGASETATPTALPPGVSADGSIDTDALSRAHVEYVANRSYTWFVNYDTGGAGFVGGVFARRAVVGNDTFFVKQVTSGPGSNTSLYVNESGGFLRSVTGNETRYELLEIPGDHEEYVFADEAIRRFLGGTTFNVTTVERNGRTYYRLHASGGPAPRTLSDSGAVIRNYTATAYVTLEGFVRSMAVNYDRVIDGERSEVAFRYDYSRLGESEPTPPNWTDEVSQRSTPTPAAPEPSDGNSTASDRSRTQTAAETPAERAATTAPGTDDAADADGAEGRDG